MIFVYIAWWRNACHLLLLRKMEKHKCKLCFRSFSNGRALGGHMRSHMLNLPIPPKQEQPKNPKKSIRLADPEFSFAVDAASVQKKIKLDKLSKTESWADPEPVSSISDATTEEDVAFSRGKYKCETCNKVFRSYQALGGHRASHKKIKACAPIKEVEFEPENASNPCLADAKIHECPVCFRKFTSGQALGGHKRSHISGSAAAAAAPAPPPPPRKASSKVGDSMIDLNLPAPIEEDDISQIEHSAVSDAEFVNPIRR
ncbi:unnamed protein product, partial [Vitis vinifera]